MKFPKKEELRSADWLGLNWTEWRRLDTKELGEIPRKAGIYRVRHPDRSGLEYIGETGNSNGLRTRIQQLSRGTRAEEMPYRDPHTSAPCLWALLDKHGSKLEISFCNPEISRSKRDRKGLEKVMIAIHRKVEGESPTANFGRIIKGYKQSSYRKDGIIGHKDSSQDKKWTSLPPLDWSKKSNVKSSSWMGLNWSEPEKLENRTNAELPSSGVYRIWFPTVSPPLAYIGETGAMKNRLRKHQKTFGDKSLFSVAKIEKADTKAKRLEIETELVGAHFIEENSVPKGQEGGSKSYTD